MSPLSELGSSCDIVEVTAELVADTLEYTVSSSNDVRDCFPTPTGEECTSSLPGMTIETNNCGVCCNDVNGGTGYIMYSEADVHSRMSVNGENYDHFVCVKNEGGEWLQDTNDAWVAFTPVDTDVLVASLDFSADTVTSLQGQIDMLDGLRRGFDSGDLAFSANARIGAGGHNGGDNEGEFFIDGSFFSRACGSPAPSPEDLPTAGGRRLQEGTSSAAEDYIEHFLANSTNYAVIQENCLACNVSSDQSSSPQGTLAVFELVSGTCQPPVVEIEFLHQGGITFGGSAECEVRPTCRVLSSAVLRVCISF